MCYDISLQVEIEKLAAYYPDIDIPVQLELHFPIAHMQAHTFSPVPVIVNEDAKLQLKLFEWGLIAPYMDSPEKIKKQRAWMCNARAEKILDKQAFWYKIRGQRCLVPVSGIFEHRTVAGVKKKVPYHVRWRNRGFFCLPALYNYSSYPDPETGEVPGTFALITTHANELMKFIHNDGENKHRMPLFLPPELEKTWLKPSISDKEIEEVLNFQAAPDDLGSWTVATIRTPYEREDGRQKFEPFAWQELNLPGNDQPSLF